MFRKLNLTKLNNSRSYCIYKEMVKPSVQKVQSASLITAIKTPYLENGKIDLCSFDYNASKQIEHGVDGFVIGGTTGEGHLLSWDEHIMLIAHAKHNFGDKCLIIGNTGSNSTKEAMNATEQGFAVGMDASLQINPYYGKTSESGLINHFNKVMKIGPAIIYNVPGRTSQDISVDIMTELSNNKNFVGVKECMGRDRIQEYSDRNILTWSGNDDECHDTRHINGCNGVISVTSNIIPAYFRKMMDEPSPEIKEKTEKLINLLFKLPNPIGINTLMSMLGLCKPVFRLPYVELDSKIRKEALDIINEIGLKHFIHKDLRFITSQEFKHIY